MSNRRCWVPNCINAKPKLALKTRVFVFPRNVKRCREWLKAIGDPGLAKNTWSALTQHKYICRDHFLEHHITATQRTAENAIPVIFSESRTPLSDADLREFDASVPVERRSCIDSAVTHDHVANVASSSPDERVEVKISHDSSELSCAPAACRTEASFTRPGHNPLLEQIQVVPLGTSRDSSVLAPVAATWGAEEVSGETVHDLPKSYPSPTDICEGDELDTHTHVDYATIDHDYVATAILRKSQIPVYEEDLSKRHTMDNVRKDLCRLCGLKGEILMPIFEPTPDTLEDVPMFSKIELYLPIKVKVGDPLPSCICSSCFEVLNHWHELYVTCAAADAILWKTFGGETDRISLNKLDCAVRRDIQQNASISNVEIQTLAEQMSSLSPTHELKEKEDIVRAHCGESKTRVVQTEDESFTEEFDKNLATYGHVSFKCRFCYELFKSSADRKNHIAMCRQLSTICELCGHKVSCRKDLKRHKYRKHNKKVVIRPRYLCDKCDRRFMSAGGLNFHMQNIHDAKDPSVRYCCELCCTTFMREVYFRNHKRKHEKGKIKSIFQIEAFRHGGNSENPVGYSCPVCQEMFSDVLSLVVHLTTKKKIKCLLCLKTMSCEKRFFLHVCGQWTCQYCLKSFDNRVKWLVHERLHTGEKPIKCRICDQSFRTWQARRYHETHHEPAYQCSYCGKSFKNKCVFQDHVACHEGKVFLCHLCNKTFSGRKNLGKHMNFFHKYIKKSVCNNE